MAHPGTSTHIACVVVNYNAGSLLEDCVNSWLESAPSAPIVHHLFCKSSQEDSSGWVNQKFIFK